MTLDFKIYVYKCGFKSYYVTLNGHQILGPHFSKIEVLKTIYDLEKGTKTCAKF